MQMEMQGDVTSQRRWEAYDKLGTFGIYAIGIVLAIQVRPCQWCIFNRNLQDRLFRCWCFGTASTALST
jgi:hypothetical protein